MSDQILRDQILCDSHIHVFGREAMTKETAYIPPAKDLNDFVTEACVENIGRAVVVQASINGTDNSKLLDVLRASQPLQLRGVAMIDEHSQDLETLVDAGVRALRIQDRSRLGIHDLARLPQLAAFGAEVDWHVELNTEPARYHVLQSLLGKLPAGIKVVLDHFGHCDPKSLEDRENLCRLLDTGLVWVKLAPTRVSQQVGQYEDLLPLVQRLVDGYSERCIWGSDWPHVMTAEPVPRTDDMLRFYKQALTEQQFAACFSSNAAALYRF